MALFNVPAQHLCIIRTSALGDCCNALGLGLALKKHWPQTTITWITGPKEAELISLYPQFQVKTFDKKQSIQGYLTLWKQLKNTHFDAILNLQTSIRSSLLTLGLHSRYHLGYDKVRARELQAWFTNVKVPSPKSAHVVDGFMAFAHILGLPHLKPLWYMPEPLPEQRWVHARFGKTPFIILTLGSSKSVKNWTPHAYAELTDYLSKRGYAVLLCGGPSHEEAYLGQYVASHCSSKITNLIGQTTLHQLLSLIQHAQALIGPDSGPLHLANLCGTPAIGLHAIHPASRTGAYRYQKYAVCIYETLYRKKYGNKKRAWRTPIKSAKAMADIKPEQVYAMFETLHHTVLQKDETPS